MKNLMIISGVIAGGILATLPYLPISTEKSVQPVSTPIVFSDIADKKVQENLPDLNAILNLSIPEPNDPIEIWEAFWIDISAINVGNNDSPMSHTSPLLSLYTYIAKHQPDLFYNKMQFLSNHYYFLDVFLKIGLLEDWYEKANNPKPWLLVSREAVKSIALKYGTDQAKELTAKSFLLSEPNGYKVNLYNFRFASDAMSQAELSIIIDQFEKGRFKYDPRHVKALIGMQGVSNEQLVRLIKSQAYPERMMSSYMTTALKLKDPEYVIPMAKDVISNASQPSNFYCSGCALSLFTDGLIGNDLERFARSNQLKVTDNGVSLIINKIPYSTKGAAL